MRSQRRQPYAAETHTLIRISARAYCGRRPAAQHQRRHIRHSRRETLLGGLPVVESRWDVATIVDLVHPSNQSTTHVVGVQIEILAQRRKTERRRVMVRFIDPLARCRPGLRAIPISSQHGAQAWVEQPVLRHVVEQNQTTASVETNVGLSYARSELTNRPGHFDFLTSGTNRHPSISKSEAKSFSEMYEVNPQVPLLLGDHHREFFTARLLKLLSKDKRRQNQF